jgi:hypothetical protein
MTLLEQQQLFMRLLPSLISYAISMGYQLTQGDGYRDPRVFGKLGQSKGYGHPKSAHKQRLAIDINLFKDGKWLQETEDFKLLAEYWVKLHPLCRAGYYFGDGNHFSMERDGVK